MNIAVPFATGLLITASSALAAPDVIYDNTTFSSDAESQVFDPAIPLNLMQDDEHDAFSWATSAQGSIADIATNTPTHAHAHGGVSGEAWENGFEARGYSRSTTEASNDQVCQALARNSVQLLMTIDEITRVTGRLCIALEETLQDSYAITTFVRTYEDGSTDYVVSHAWNDPGDCRDFDIVLQPGQYMFWGIAVTHVENEGDGSHDARAEFTVNMDFNSIFGPDIDLDGDVDGSDLAALLGGWGTQNPVLDFNGDQIVNGGDLAILLAAWT